MDRTRHQLTVGYTPAEADAPTGQELAAVSGQVLADQVKTVILGSTLFEEPIESTDSSVVLSLDEAIYKAQHKLMLETKGKSAGKAITCRFLSAVPVITRGTYRALLESIYKCTTFSELAAQLMRIYNNGPADGEQRFLIDKIDDYVTAEYNRMLRDRFSLPTSVDSFSSDEKDILEYINKKFGPIYGDTYLEYQKEFMLKIFTPMQQATYDSIIYSLIDPGHSAEPTEGDDTPPAYATAVFQLISMTAVGFSSRELNVGLLEKHAGVLSEENFPGLLTYSKAVHKQTSEEHPVAHHYIVTSDSKVYEVVEGLIGRGNHLISQIR